MLEELDEKKLMSGFVVWMAWINNQPLYPKRIKGRMKGYLMKISIRNRIKGRMKGISYQNTRSFGKCIGLEVEK